MIPLEISRSIEERRISKDDTGKFAVCMCLQIQSFQVSICCVTSSPSLSHQPVKSVLGLDSQERREDTSVSCRSLIKMMVVTMKGGREGGYTTGQQAGESLLLSPVVSRDRVMK